LAINIQTLKTRSLTALIFVIVMLTGLFVHQWTYVSLMLFVMLGCLYEFNKILKKIYGGRYLLYLPFALIYIMLPLLLMIDLGLNGTAYLQPGLTNTEGSFTYSPLLPCAIIFSIWINDTMAYIVGSMIGKTPFSPISPKKTWEGTIGGAVLCVVVISLLGAFLQVAQLLPWYHWAAIAAICAVFGTLGDLLESKLKRMAGIKDSGTIMPGHGGFLDRFDSLLLAAGFVWLYIKFIC